MTVGDFCKYLKPDDFVIITKPDGGFASGFVTDMSQYFDEEILHISADKYTFAFKVNKNIGYELDVS